METFISRLDTLSLSSNPDTTQDNTINVLDTTQDNTINVLDTFN